MKPASNAKMYTCALALDKLGPDFHIKTSLYAAAKPDADGVIHGDVIVYGRGDPSFASRFNNGDYGLSLKPMLDAIHAAGLKRIDGDLVGDDSYFHGAPYGSEWTWDDLQFYYGAPASALTVEDNCLDLVFKPGARAGDPCEILTKPKTSYVVFDNRSETGATNAKPGIELYKPLGEDKVVVWGGVPLGSRGADDSVAVSHPALWFVSLLKDALAKDGVTVTGNLRSIGWLEREKTPLDVSNLVEVASVSSRPLSEIVKNTLKPSQNQYAQLLLLQVGANSSSGRNRRSHSTEDDGLTEMRRFLTSAGIKRGMALLEEGSGLSRGALVTPSASVQLLTYMAHHRCASVFTNGLPIAGVDGTLRNRFKGTAAAGNLRAKTGSLGHVDTVSGYMTTKGGDPLVLSVMLNNYSAPGRRGDGRVEIDALIKMLADFDGKLN
jgi:D-alanyl-D-alanine carboxypeptidase/D-alanyl-D-alanine-endopeptidase (penicillin-binding protein 4)